jgi:signal transduction histidine kinase
MFNFLSSLRFRAFAVAFLSFASLFWLVNYNINRLLEQIAIENIQSNVRQTSETMNLAIAPYTSAEGLETLTEYMTELISGSEVAIVYFALVDESGQVILATEATPSPLPEPTSEEKYLSESVLHINQPTLLYGNQIGQLRFGMTWKQLKKGIAELNHELFVLLSVGFAFMTLLIFFLVFILVKRISSLMSVSVRFGSGDYDVRANGKGHDELSRLARNFNNMAESIKTHVDDLEISRHEVSKLNETLEDRVRERTAELKTALDDLKKTQAELVHSEKLASLGSIVAAVAHELNTPIGNALTVATSFSEKTREFEELIKQGLKRSTLNDYTENAYSAAELMERNLGKAAELILSFKNVAIDQTSSKRREFDLQQTINEIVSTLRPTFKKSGIELQTDLQPGIKMDSYPGSIGQIITNFINNSILHGFKDRDAGVMHLSFELHEKNWIKLVFSDNGNGISKENIRQIYDPFFTTQLGKGGSGLGLNIVHNIVTGLLGGSIDVDSEIGHGVKFTLFIPVVAPEVDPAVLESGAVI